MRSTKNNKKVFLDTSILVAALLSQKGGSFYIITQLNDVYDFVINKFVLKEVESVIEQKFSGDNDMYNMLFLLLSSSSVDIIANPGIRELQTLDSVISKKDRPILCSAINNADYLISLDKEFLNDLVSNFSKKKGLHVFRPKDFLEMYRNS